MNDAVHSELIGYAFDGFPIYGAHGFANADGSGGITRMRSSYQLRTIENATMNWINGAAGARNQAFSGDTQLLGLWAQDTWKIAPRWKAVLGARAERWSASNGQTGNATTTVSHAERNETYISPKAALAYQVNDRWVLKASTGRRPAARRAGYTAPTTLSTTVKRITRRNSSGE